MQHIRFLESNGHLGASLAKSASGRFYTGELVGRRLAEDVVERYYSSKLRHEEISILEPFAGDGRLVVWFISEWISRGYPRLAWNISLWDLDEHALAIAKNSVEAAIGAHGSANVRTAVVDTFCAISNVHDFDVLLTNPPWEVIKPDRRELNFLATEERDKYILQIREYDHFLSAAFPLSQPKKKFAGWGTNLSRVGLEAILRALGENSVCGIVLPSSFAADVQTSELRAWVLKNFFISSIIYYPAEVKQFDGADSGAIALCICSGSLREDSTYMGRYQLASSVVEGAGVDLDAHNLKEFGYAIPVAVGAPALKIISHMSRVGATWAELEGREQGRLWAGREVDETGIKGELVSVDSNLPPFIKGRMLKRFGKARSTSSLNRPDWRPPRSTAHRRIAWRDVSRPSQARRMVATIIEPGAVSGNSVGVAHFEDSNEVALLALLGIINSTSFEIMLRATLATGHISLSTLRRMPIPTYEALSSNQEFADMVDAALTAEDEMAISIDAFVAARIYKLDAASYEWVLSQFHGIHDECKCLMLKLHNKYWGGDASL